MNTRNGPYDFCMADTGRPTNYKDEYCADLIEHMAQGLSYQSFAGVVGVSKQTIYNWEKSHPEFLDAKKIGFEKNRLWWEQKARDHLINHPQGPSLNSTVWIFNMKNRFPEEWREKQPGEDDKTITHKLLEGKSTEELEEVSRELDKKLKGDG